MLTVEGLPDLSVRLAATALRWAVFFEKLDLAYSPAAYAATAKTHFPHSNEWKRLFFRRSTALCLNVL